MAFFKAKLVLVGMEKILEFERKNNFEKFEKYGALGNSPVIIRITMINFTRFKPWYKLHVTNSLWEITMQ